MPATSPPILQCTEKKINLLVAKATSGNDPPGDSLSIESHRASIAGINISFSELDGNV